MRIADVMRTADETGRWCWFVFELRWLAIEPGVRKSYRLFHTSVGLLWAR